MVWIWSDCRSYLLHRACLFAQAACSLASLLRNPLKEAKHPSKGGMREDKERRDVGRYLSQVITRFVQFDRNVLAA